MAVKKHLSRYTTVAWKDYAVRRQKRWPYIYERQYKSGKVSHVVDLGVIHGKRVRRTFPTRSKADKFARRIGRLREKHGVAPLTLTSDAWAAAKRLHDLLVTCGLSLHDAYRHYIEEIIPFLRTPPVAEIADELLAEVEASGARPDTVRTLRTFLGEFKRKFGQRKITDIRKQELVEFCLRLDTKPKTRRNRRAMASQLYSFAIENDWALKNMASRLPIPHLEDKEPEILTVEQVRRLLIAAEKCGVLGYVVLAVFAGIRPQELQRLDWSNVHVHDRVVVIQGSASKIHRRREVAILDTLLAWLARCRKESGPIAEGADFMDRLRQARTASGIHEWPNDVLRHTYATNHAAAFKNPGETARQMGHIGGLGILNKHYVAFVPEKEAMRFWALLPDVVLGLNTREIE